MKNVGQNQAWDKAKKYRLDLESQSDLVNVTSNDPTFNVVAHEVGGQWCVVNTKLRPQGSQEPLKVLGNGNQGRRSRAFRQRSRTEKTPHLHGAIFGRIQCQHCSLEGASEMIRVVERRVVSLLDWCELRQEIQPSCPAPLIVQHSEISTSAVLRKRPATSTNPMQIHALGQGREGRAGTGLVVKIDAMTTLDESDAWNSQRGRCFETP